MTNEQFEALVNRDAERLIQQGVEKWEIEEALQEKLTYDYGAVDSAGIYHEFEEGCEFDD